jgi:general stress protein YciG
MTHARKRGFAVITLERQREIARQGGQAAHRKGAAHEFTSEEARAAGRKGGYAVSRNRAHMAAIDRKGGQHRSLRSLPQVVAPVSPSEPTNRESA